MCDYSLMAVPNRLAQEGEELVTHRFRTGSLGMASSVEMLAAIGPRTFHRTLWRKIRAFFDPFAAPAVCAVCVPPGARLLVCEIPANLQLQWDVRRQEEAVFTQLTAAVNTYRDALRFPSGREVRLQELSEGITMRVLDLGGVEEPAVETLQALG